MNRRSTSNAVAVPSAGRKWRMYPAPPPPVRCAPAGGACDGCKAWEESCWSVEIEWTLVEWWWLPATTTPPHSTPRAPDRAHQFALQVAARPDGRPGRRTVQPRLAHGRRHVRHLVARQRAAHHTVARGARARVARRCHYPPRLPLSPQAQQSGNFHHQMTAKQGAHLQAAGQRGSSGAGRNVDARLAWGWGGARTRVAERKKTSHPRLYRRTRPRAWPN